jgi:cell division protein FtsB
LRPKAILITCAVIAGSVLAWATIVDDSWSRSRTKEAEARALEAEVKALEAENQALATRASALAGDTDTPVLEEAIREELGYVKQDEHVLRLPAEDR